MATKATDEIFWGKHRLDKRAVAALTPDELARFIPAEIEKWAQVVKDTGITPE